MNSKGLNWIQKTDAGFNLTLSNDDSKKVIMINITNEIIVKASKKLVDEWCSEDYRKNLIKKFLLIDLTSGSKALLHDSPLIFHPYWEFSDLFHSFASSFVLMEIEKSNYDTMQIFDYVESFRFENTYHQVNFQRVKTMNQGYMILNLAQNNNTNKTLDKFEVDSKSYYILGGTYISPFAGSLICGPRTSGIMLDTT